MKRFTAALNCIDGRTQIPVTYFMKYFFDVEYVDLITEPGMDYVLSQGKYNDIESIKKNLIISINAHESKVVAIVGHSDCAANPVSDEQHIKDISQAVQTVRNWNLPLFVVGLFVNVEQQVYIVHPKKEQTLVYTR